jgi:enoyl-CoA hydratase
MTQPPEVPDVAGVPGSAAGLLLVERIGRVRRLTLNRPRKRNALNPELLGLIYAALDDAAGDPGVRVVVLRGAGPSFSAGYDLSAGGHVNLPPPDDEQVYQRLALEMNRVWQCPIPIIAQVHGHCLGAATDLVFMCDLVMASHDAAFGHPGVRTQGTPPINMWLYLAGAQLAKWLMLTGESIRGDEAARRGLILSSHDARALDAEVMTAAERIAQTSRAAAVVNKAVLNYGIDLMGRAQLQRFSVAQDAIAHASAESMAFHDRVDQAGATAVFTERAERDERH